ncbi:unnamed protein product [Pedinophyceae sp. YPF-701]|nr:unnamed protein product [Pedinophyceae sp. YPF-701]
MTQHSHANKQMAFRVEAPVDAEEELFKGCELVEDHYERMDQIGQGTFGQVYLGRSRKDGKQLVALKKVKMDNEKEGFPITAIREIRILQKLRHDNVISLKAIMRSKLHVTNGHRGSIYMVFEYMDADLAALIQRRRTDPLPPSHLKNLMRQLLRALKYCHGQNVLHRDLKASNILLSSSGILKLADFGLARARERGKQTNRVITLWYRPPELLLGAENYGFEIDTWSAGCIFAEMLTGRPLFPGQEETHQLRLIVELLGAPTEASWPGVERLPHYHFVPQTGAKSSLRARLANRGVTDAAFDLLEGLLQLNPRRRLTAAQALDMPYFKEHPTACRDDELDIASGCHEFRSRKQHKEKKRQPEELHRGPSKR